MKFDTVNFIFFNTPSRLKRLTRLVIIQTLDQSFYIKENRHLEALL